jgi:hypothetical protein
LPEEINYFFKVHEYWRNFQFSVSFEEHKQILYATVTAIFRNLDSEIILEWVSADQDDDRVTSILEILNLASGTFKVEKKLSPKLETSQFFPKFVISFVSDTCLAKTIEVSAQRVSLSWEERGPCYLPSPYVLPSPFPLSLSFFPAESQLLPPSPSPTALLSLSLSHCPPSPSPLFPPPFLLLTLLSHCPPPTALPLPLLSFPPCSYFLPFSVEEAALDPTIAYYLKFVEKRRGTKPTLLAEVRGRKRERGERGERGKGGNWERRAREVLVLL